MERSANCLIVVAGGVTAVTNSAIAGLVDEAGRGDYVADIWGAGAGINALTEDKLVDLGAQKRKVIEGLRRTPGSVLPGAHRVLDESQSATLVEALRLNKIGALFVLGGLPAVELARFASDAAQKANYSLTTLCVPLSAENEVDAGDHNPGYGSMARFVASGVRDAGRAAAGGEEPLLVVEIGGKTCGWATASSALARDSSNPSPHAVLVPEVAVNLETLTDELRRAYQKYGYAVCVTSEGAKSTEGQSLNGDALLALMSEKLNIAGHCDRPGQMARVAQNTVSRADGDEAYNLGALAMRLAGDEASGYVVTAGRDAHLGERGDRGYRSVEVTVQLNQVGNEPRLLPANYMNESGTQVTDAFLDWARPLVGGALPEYISLA
jgi:6-phosphofructokinase